MLIWTVASNLPKTGANMSKKKNPLPASFFSSCANYLWDTCLPYFDINKLCFLSWIRAHTKAGRLINTNCGMLPSETWKKWGEKKVWKLFDLQETRERWAPMHDLTCKAKYFDKAHHETFLTGPLASVSTIRMLLTTWCFFPKRGIMQKVWSSASHQDGFFSPAGKFFT